MPPQTDLETYVSEHFQKETYQHPSGGGKGNLHPRAILEKFIIPMNGVEAVRRIYKEIPTTKIIVLSMNHKRQFVMDMLKAGVSGYMLKTDVHP